MKNIVFVFNPGCNPVPAINGGAIESLITNLVNENELQQKFKFHVIMCKHISDKMQYDYSKYNFTKFYDFYQSDFKFKLGRLVNALNKRLNYALSLYSTYEKYILSTISKINPDFVIYEGTINSTVIKLKKELGKEKLVLHVHHQILHKYKLDKHIGRMLCVSDFVKQDWQDSKKLDKNFKYQILNNVLTSTTFSNKLTEKERQELKNKFHIKDNDFVIVFCGRLIKEKGIDVLIKAVQTVKKENLKLMIIGESGFKNSTSTPFVKNLKDLVKEDKNIFFTGFVPNEELYKYYSLANLQVIPSVWEEVAGIVALEGRAVGLPQIVTKSGGLTEYASKNAIILSKDSGLQERLQDEIVNFYEGKYKNLKEQEQIAGAKEYYEQFDELISE